MALCSQAPRLSGRFASSDPLRWGAFGGLGTPLCAEHFGPWRWRAGAPQGLWLRVSVVRTAPLTLSPSEDSSVRGSRLPTHSAEEPIFHGTAAKGNRHAKRYIAAFGKLCAHGDAGRDALAVLFTHPRMDVRVAAAAFLLRHRTAEAKAVLEEAAKGKGLAALEAQQTLENWANGSWALDPG